MNHQARLTLPLLAIFALYIQPAGADTTIPAGTGAYTANTAGENYIVAAGDTRSINSGGGVVVTLGGATGPFNLTVNGTVRHAGTNRAIRGTNNNVVFNVTIGASGLVQAYLDDAIQAQTGTFNVTNSGTIYAGSNIGSTPTVALATGQALDLASATGGTVINNATGLIRADGHDAVRLGSNMTMTNYGTVYAATVVNDSPANNAFNTPAGSTTETYSAGEGVSFENGSNSSLDNYGSISGARHGVESDVNGTNITITNRATGEIIGRNGSGIGFDATNASVTNVVIHNYGLVRGDYAGAGNIIDRTGAASLTNDGDGDGIDIDGSVTINNYATGEIISTGAGGFDTGGRANNGEGIAIGGGIIVNDGLIQGAGRGILVNNDSNLDKTRSGSAATSITNNAGATIEGQSGFAIRLENKLGDARDNDTIINAGTIIGNGSIPDPEAIVLRQNGLFDPNSTGTLDGVVYTGTGSARFIRGEGSAIQMGEGADVLTNTGTITGNTGLAINMEGGNDTVNFNAGTITGAINGGTGTDTLALGNGVTTTSAVLNFEQFNVAAGTATLSGAVSGTTFNKGGAGTLVLSGAFEFSGATSVDAGTLELTGDATLDSLSVYIGDGAVLKLGAAERLNDEAVLTVDGELVLNGGDETIRVLNGSGAITLNANELHVTEGGTFTGTLDASGSRLVIDGNLSVSDSASLSYETLSGTGVIETSGAVFTNLSGSTVRGFLTFSDGFTNQGTLAPGNSPGLTVVLGDYIEAGTLEAELETTTPVTGHDQVQVGGTVTLQPTSELVVQAFNGALPVRGNIYQIIADATVPGAPKAATGAFGSVSFDIDGALGAGGAVTNAAVVFDRATGQVIATGLNDAASTFADLGTTANERAAAQAIFDSATATVGQNQIDTTTAAGEMAAQLILANGGSAANLAFLTPSYYGALSDYAFAGDQAMSGLVLSRVSSLTNIAGAPESGASFFAGSLNADRDTADQAEVNRRDLYAGGDYAVSEKLTTGLLIVRADGDISSTLGRGDVRGVGVTAYAKRKLTERLDLTAAVGYTDYDYDLRRPTLAGVATADADGHGYTATVGVSYLGYARDGFSFSPRAAISYSRATIDGFTENGAADRLALDGYDATRVTAQAGVSLGWATEALGRPLSFELTGGLEHLLTDDKDSMTATMVSDATVSYPVQFSDADKTAGVAGLSVGYALTKSAAVFAGYQARVSGDSSHDINVGFRLGF
ncbi:MAG TPA: autotransporter domain-containing protein [Rariglobus sp.]|nr:autotransporter domain-containing protein [Rariglobus sp.]